VPEAVKESIAKNLSYWSTRDGDDTMVTLWNPADEQTNFNGSAKRTLLTSATSSR